MDNSDIESCPLSIEARVASLLSRDKRSTKNTRVEELPLGSGESSLDESLSTSNIYENDVSIEGNVASTAKNLSPVSPAEKVTKQEINQLYIEPGPIRVKPQNLTPCPPKRSKQVADPSSTRNNNAKDIKCFSKMLRSVCFDTLHTKRVNRSMEVNFKHKFKKSNSNQKKHNETNANIKLDAVNPQSKKVVRTKRLPVGPRISYEKRNPHLEGDHDFKLRLYMANSLDLAPKSLNIGQDNPIHERSGMERSRKNLRDNIGRNGRL